MKLRQTKHQQGKTNMWYKQNVCKGASKISLLLIWQSTY